MGFSILVVDDEKDIREYLKELLLDNRYSVETAGNGVAAIKKAEETQPDLVLLDVKLPDIDGRTVCEEIKKTSPDIAVIMLTAMDKTSDLVEGFKQGADDYVTKPFTSAELLARINARLKSKGSTSSKMKLADLTMDTKTMEVKRGDKKIDLTPQEFKLLEYLIKNKGQVLSRDMILNHVWGYSSEVETRVVDVYVGYLRKKVDGGKENKLVHSVRGFGYTLKED